MFNAIKVKWIEMKYLVKNNISFFTCIDIEYLINNCPTSCNSNICI